MLSETTCNVMIWKHSSLLYLIWNYSLLDTKLSKQSAADMLPLLFHHLTHYRTKRKRKKTPKEKQTVKKFCKQSSFTKKTNSLNNHTTAIPANYLLFAES
jgi:hypothetical protein